MGAVISFCHGKGSIARAPGRGVSETPEKRRRTPKLDDALTARYRADPQSFTRRTLANLSVGGFLLILAGILSYFAVKVVGFSSGGDALLLMVMTILLITLAVLHDVYWRLNLMKTPTVNPNLPGAQGGKAS